MLLRGKIAAKNPLYRESTVPIDKSREESKSCNNWKTNENQHPTEAEAEDKTRRVLLGGEI